MKKLTCHCGEIEIKIKLKGNSNDYYRCNCSICKRKGSITTIVDKEDLEIVKGAEKIKCYQFNTKAAKHFFCSHSAKISASAVFALKFFSILIQFTDIYSITVLI